MAIILGYYTKKKSTPKSVDKFLAELRELMIVYHKNLHHAKEIQKWAHNKGVKPRSYVFDEKIWLNTKYIWTKPNQKLEAKFFRLFQMLHPIRKQAYKIKFSKN